MVFLSIRGVNILLYETISYAVHFESANALQRAMCQATYTATYAKSSIIKNYYGMRKYGVSK